MSHVEEHNEDLRISDGTAGGRAWPDGLREPRQDRSRRSLERVLDAGAEVLAERGWERFTIADVARLAGASSGLIYKRFENKAALLEAIFLREQERLVAEENARLASVHESAGSLAEFIAGAVVAMASVARREAPLIRVFNGRSALEPHLLEHVKRGHTAPRVFADAVLQRRQEIPHPDPEFAADMAFWLVNAAIDRRVNTPMWRHWREDPEADWQPFVSELSRAVSTYLLTAVDPVELRLTGEVAA